MATSPRLSLLLAVDSSKSYQQRDIVDEKESDTTHAPLNPFAQKTIPSHRERDKSGDKLWARILSRKQSRINNESSLTRIQN